MRGHVRNYQLKTGEKRWAAIVYRGKRVAKNGGLQDAYRWIRGFHTQKATQNELNKLLGSLDDGTYAEASKQTLTEFLERWLATVKPNLEAKTFEHCKEIVDLNINPRLGTIHLTKLRPQQLSEPVTNVPVFHKSTEGVVRVKHTHFLSIERNLRG